MSDCADRPQDGPTAECRDLAPAGEPSRPGNEARRLAAIADLGVVSAETDPELSALARVGASLLAAPICLVTLIDADTVWVKARVGTDLQRLPRCDALCSHAISEGRALIVENLAADPRFRDNAMVSGPDGIRFYAGHPVSLGDDLMIGTVCVLDTAPRAVSDADRAMLADLAALASASFIKHRETIEAGRLARERARQNRTIEDQSRDLATQKRIIEQAADIARVGAWETDLVTGELRWSDGMYRIHGMSPDTPMAYGAHYDMYPEPHRTRIKRIVALARARGGAFDTEVPAVTPDGRRRWFRVAGGMQYEDGRPVRWCGMKQDITQQKRLLQRIERLATTDAVTGLANRAAFLTVANKSAGADRRQGLLLLDLDGFKRVNDTHGHAAGDACLRAVAARLKRACRGAQMVARLGGDEFAILPRAHTTVSDLGALAQRVVEAMHKPVSWRGLHVHLGVSIGIACDALPGAELMRRADLALYAAKEAGRGTWRHFDPEMQAAAEARFRQIEDIHGALQRGELRVHYQQKVELATGRHVGFEALVRWRKSEDTVLGPSAFAAALEDPELSARVGDHVLQEVVRQAKAWTLEGVDFGHVAINLSTAQVLSDGLVERILSLLAGAGLPPEILEVEVTEGVFLDGQPEVIRRTLEALRAAGIRLALDDFGTGFASLSHLRQFQVDIMKIDRSFVSRLGRSDKETAIVQSMVQLAKSLGIEVVAEGIETAAEADFLRAIGCTYGQGYWFAHPSEAEFCTRWLKALHRLSA